ncbi:MAG: M48 family metalloprotease [Bacteroidota bacterium]
MCFASLAAQFAPGTPLPQDSTTFFAQLSERVIEANKDVPVNYLEQFTEMQEEHLEDLRTDIRDSLYLFDAEIGTYLTDLMKRIATANTLDVDPIVLLRRTQQANAASMGNGIFAVNLGLFQNLSTEERLAFVLCHEMAHDQLEHMQHNLLDYCQREEGLADTRKQLSRRRVLRNRKRRRALASTIRSRVYTTYRQRRLHELAADSLGLAYFRKLKVSMAGAQNALDGLGARDLAHLRDVDFVELLKTEGYPIKEKWLAEPAAMFGGSFGGQEAPVEGFWESDSVSTHPNVEERVVRLYEVIASSKADTTLAETPHSWLPVVDRELIRAQLESGVSGLAFVNALRILAAEPDRTDLQALVGESLLKTYQAIEQHDFDEAVPPPAYFREPNARKAARMLRQMRKSELKKLTLAYLDERSQLKAEPALTNLLAEAESYFATLD